MVRQFIGNIKGPKGDTGPKGESGGFNGETIGVNNLIDITKLTTRGANSTHDYELDSGLINYNNVEWYVRGYFTLNGVKHTFRVKDFSSNPDYASGRINLQMLDSDGVVVINEFVTPKTIVNVDLTGRDRQEYDVQMRVTNTTTFSGFIEKPMLVEGDIPVLWNSYKPVKDYFMTTILNQSVTGSLSNPNVVALSQIESDTTLEHNDSAVSLTTGLWEITVNARFSPVTFDGSTYLIVYLNDDDILRINLSPSMQKEKSFSYVFKVTENALITLRAGKTTSEEIRFEGSSSNKLSLVKLSEI